MAKYHPKSNNITAKLHLKIDILSLEYVIPIQFDKIETPKKLQKP